MKRIYDLKIGPKLLVATGFTLVMMAVVVGMAVWGNIMFSQRVDETRRYSDARAALRIMEGSVYRQVIAMRGYIISGEASGLEVIEPARRDYLEALSTVRSSLRDASDLALVAQIDHARDEVERMLSRKQNLREQGQMAAIVTIEQKTMPQLFSAFLTPHGTLMADITTKAEAAIDASKGLSQLLTLVMVALGLLSVGVSYALSTLISRSITIPLKRLIATTQAMAQGELPARVEMVYRDCVGDLALAFDEMVGRLRGIVSQVRDTASTVSSGADHISSSALQMAQAAQSQAVAVEETSSSMEEMAASITQVSGNAQSLAVAVEETSSSIEEMAASIQQVAGNADTLGAAVSQTSASVEQLAASVQMVARNVSEANQEAETSAQVASKGRAAVDQTIEGMQRISSVMGEVVTVIGRLGKSSDEIGEIIAVIDDIADQTNLLALNAAIEAARAGEHGRGFAVVADEVRKLAERSAKATGEIAKLIKGIQKETEQAVQATQQGNSAIVEGTQLARSAGESLGAIVTSVDQVSMLMGQIAQATQEQTRAAEQITGAVGSMSMLTHQVTQATREQARGSEQIIRAVETMNRMTQQVSVATSEQKKGGEQVVHAVESINRAARETAEATGFVAQSSSELQGQASRLMEAIAFFKDAQDAALVRTSPSREIQLTVSPGAPKLPIAQR